MRVNTSVIFVSPLPLFGTITTNMIMALHSGFGFQSTCSHPHTAMHGTSTWTGDY